MGPNYAFLELITLLGVGALAVGIAFLAAVSLLRFLSGERPLLLTELLAMQGVDLARNARTAGGRDFAVAVQRCMQCEARARCVEWLGRGRRDGYEAFCPNSTFVSRMKRFSVSP